MKKETHVLTADRLLDFARQLDESCDVAALALPYANSATTEHKSGDVVRNADGDDGTIWVHAFRGESPWFSVPVGHSFGVPRHELPARLWLVVRNGEPVA